MTAYLDALGLLCALGNNPSEVTARLYQGCTDGMQAQAGWVQDLALTVGQVSPAPAPLPRELADQDTGNNRLLLAALGQIQQPLEQAIARYGHSRIAVVLGTSTSGIEESSQGIRHWVEQGVPAKSFSYCHQELSAPASVLARHLSLSGPCYSISTACTSSAKALQSARRLLQLGVCDAVICGGVDSLSQLTLNGFHALEAVSSELCKPFSAQRQGINIGEAAAVFLMTREPLSRVQRPIALLGAGASSDAHHISAPEPQGAGAQVAMRKALADAQLSSSEIHYLNLHGTATQHNDAMESLAVQAIFPEGVPCSSTKPLTGHTLGAAGALEAAFCWLSLDDPQGRLAPHVWDQNADPALPRLQFTTIGSRLADCPKRYLMSNSFAFGGSNISLILGDAP